MDGFSSYGDIIVLVAGVVYLPGYITGIALQIWRVRKSGRKFSPRHVLVSLLLGFAASLLTLFYFYMTYRGPMSS